MAVVGRITRPHGLRGDLVIHPETDFVEQRFQPGAVFWTRSARGDEQLTIRAARLQGPRPILAFEGVSSIEDAERFAGLELRVPEDTLQPLEHGQYYLHQLAGCAVITTSGVRVGTVRNVESGAGSSRLVVDGERGEVLVPLASDICIEIDVAAKQIRIEPPAGLLDLNERAARTTRTIRTDRTSRTIE